MTKKANLLPAFLGGTAAVTQAAPTWPVTSDEDVARMAEVVRSGKWSWLGPQETAFCEEYKQFIGTPYCVCLANGTVTLQCALQAVGVVPGDEVIVPGMTWVATAQAAMDIGANIVFADIDPETLCLDPAAFAAAVTPRTKAVIPVHLYGCMCDMDRIMAIARAHGIKVVEDVAHQHGSEWRGVKAGAIGDAGSFSFQQSKILTSGEGGAVTCNDPKIYQTIFALKQVGWTPENPAAEPYGKLVPGNRYGHNYRLTEMQAVLLRGGLSRLAAQNAQREAFAARLTAGLEQLGGPLRAARRDPRVTRQAYYTMTLHFDPALAGGLTRDDDLQALNRENIGFGGLYWPVYQSPLLNLYDTTSPIPFRDPARIQDYRTLKLPATERAHAETAVVLPHHHLLGSDAYADQILAAVAKINAHLPQIRAALDAQRAKERK
ncbi:MAG: DegT/DnrJ/EryC1/StrS family aminotransferase [Lentisphaeria bacterium]